MSKHQKTQKIKNTFNTNEFNIFESFLVTSWGVARSFAKYVLEVICLWWYMILKAWDSTYTLFKLSSNEKFKLYWETVMGAQESRSSAGNCHADEPAGITQLSWQLSSR